MTDTVGGPALLAIIERVERLNEERKAIADDIRDVYAEAKGQGFDVKALKALIREREKEPSELEAADAMLDLYRQAVADAERDKAVPPASRAGARENEIKVSVAATVLNAAPVPADDLEFL